MSCQFHPTISDSKPASPTAVLLHLYYLHDPRLGLPRSHHNMPAELASCMPPPCLDDDDSELDDWDDEELWCAGPGLYVAYECVRVWIEADTAVRELCEHLEDVVSWPIDDMGVQVWHGDSKLHPTHTFAQLAWFRQLLPATTASPPSSPYDRLLLCLPADPCVCTHCCRIDFARAKRRVKLVRRHIEQHYTEVVMADDEEEEEEARKRDGRGANGGKSNRSKAGKGSEEDDSWMDEVEASEKGAKEKAGSKGQKGKAAAGAGKGAKKKQSKEAQRLAKKEKEAREERDRRAREQKDREEAARQERARREAELVAEQEKAERDREESRLLREQQERHREAAGSSERWQKDWVDEEKKASHPLPPSKVVPAPAVVAKKQQASKAQVDKHQQPSTNAATTATPSKQQQPTQRQVKSKVASTNRTSPVNKPAQQHKRSAINGKHQQHNAAPPAQNHTAVQLDELPVQSQQQQLHNAPRWKPAADGGVSQQSTSPPSRPQTLVAHSGPPIANGTVKPTAVSHSSLSNGSGPAAPQPPRWKGWGSPCATRTAQPSALQPLPLSPHSTYANHSVSPYPYYSTASTDDDNSSLNSDSFSLFSTASAMLPPSSPTSFRSHRLSSASSSNSASTVTSPSLSASGQSLSPSLPPLFCDKRADMPLPSVLSPFSVPRLSSASTSSRASTLWPLSQPQHAREGEQRRQWQDEDDEDAVLQAACSEYSHYSDDQQQDDQQRTEQRDGWHDDGAPMGGWALGEAAPGGSAFAKHDGSMYKPQYRPYREGLLVGHAGASGAHGAVGQIGPQLYGYMPLVQYVPVYISNEQTQGSAR